MWVRWTILPAVIVTASVAVAAEARVELEVVTAPDFPALDTQDWYKMISELKVSLRIRAARATDKVQVATGGSKTSPVYRVTGMITARNELVLPGGKFTLRDGARLAAWLRELREAGPPESRKKTTAFGLTTDQFDALRKDLAKPVAFSTQGKTRAEVMEKITADLHTEISLERGGRDALKEAGNLTEEFKGIAYGTALSLLLRPAGLGLAPRVAGRDVKLDIRSNLTEQQAWPAGIAAQDQRRKLLPALFEFLDVEIDKGTPMTDALAAISAKLGAPILLDHNALAELDLDLAKAKVTVPKNRITPSVLLTKLLSGASPRLTSEMRIDEADKPFIWVTTFRRP